MNTPLLLVVASLTLAFACDSEANTVAPASPKKARTAAHSIAAHSQAGSGAAGAASMSQAAAGTPAESPVKAPVMAFDPNETVSWSTDKFMLDPGQERYLCFAKTIDEDFVANAYNSAGAKFVHHLIFARTRSPEPEGFSECDVAFSSNWETLFISGAGENTLEFPKDAGHHLKLGTQLLVQMHLLNQSTDNVEGSVTINMRRSTVDAPRPVSSYIFGTAAVKLPPAATSTVVGNCAVRQNLSLIAGFPHMHLLGSSLRFEVGKAGSEMTEVFKRDPFDFNDQHIDQVEYALSAGDMTRVTCTFNNTTDQEVVYGESTLNEMCFFVGFAVDLPSQAACLEVLPPNIFGR